MTWTQRPGAPEPVRVDHEVGDFDSGVLALDNWLKRRALPNEIGGASRTLVSVFEGRVVGYYSLAAGSVVHAFPTSKARRNMPDPVPAVLLGRLAIDKSWQGKRVGEGLLQDAVLRVAGAADAIGVRVMLVHALSEDVKIFYEKFGFRPSPIEPMTLMITIEELRQLMVG